MCFSGGGGADNSALVYQQQQDAQARADETARQDRIAQGRSQIDALFDRGQTLLKPASTTAAPNNDPAALGEAFTKYKQTGNYASPMTTTTTPAEWSAPGAVPAFDDAFYNQRRQAYIDNQTPQLADQFAKARNDMSFALARAHLTRSSVAADQNARLNETNVVAAGDIANKAEGQVSDLRSKVEDSRTNLVSQLQASADPGGTANLALARTQSMAKEPLTYSPLGDVFTGIASGIGNFVQGARQAALFKQYGLSLPAATGGAGTGAGGQGTKTVGT